MTHRRRCFPIDTPAKLAGLAALVNGQVDAGTPDYRIKGDRSELVSTRSTTICSSARVAAAQYGTAYVGDAAHDFSDKTVCLTADLDMGGLEQLDAGSAACIRWTVTTRSV